MKLGFCRDPSCADVSKIVAMALPCQSCADISEIVAMALPCQSYVDVLETVAKALPCQGSAVSSKQASVVY